MIPLVYWVGVIGVPTWSIPFSALLLVQGGAAAVRGKYRIGRMDLFEGAVLVFIFAMTLSTILNPSETELGNNKLFVLFLSLGLSVYAKRHYGKSISIRHLVILAYFLIVSQFIVSIAQYITQSSIGDVGAYFGTTKARSLEAGLKQAALGIGRVVGTVGSTNLLGRTIVIFLPFIMVSEEVFSNVKKRKLHYIGKRVVVVMGITIIFMTVSRSSIGILVLLLTGASVRHISKIKPIRLWLHTTRWRLMAKVVLGFFVAVGLYLSFSNDAFRDKVSLGAEVVKLRIERAMERQTAGVSSTPGPLDIRYKLSKGALELFLEGPVVLGAGYRNTKHLPEKTSIIGVPNPDLRVHNAHLQFLAEGGIFAFISFLIITLYPIIRVYRSKGGEGVKWALIASTGCIVISMQTSTTYDSAALSPLYMLILGSAIGYSVNQ
jgi:hypothetical protein